MATKVSFRDGGKTSEEGLSRLNKVYTSDGIIKATDLVVQQAGTPDATVRVQVGDIMIGENAPSATAPDYFYHGWVTSEETVNIAANSSGSTQIDSIVAYIDLAVVSSASNDNPGVLKFTSVRGASASTAPTESAIQTAVGASNPWVLLADVSVSNGFSSIVNANITDKRPKASTLPRLISDFGRDFVVTGLSTSQSSGLVGAISAGYAYVSGELVYKPLISKTFTASKDTYIDLPKTAKPTSTDDYVYTAVANGATSGFTLAADHIRIAKVVTDGSGITSVTMVGVDAMGYWLRPTSPRYIVQGDDISGNSATSSTFVDPTSNGSIKVHVKAGQKVKVSFNNNIYRLDTSSNLQFVTVRIQKDGVTKATQAVVGGVNEANVRVAAPIEWVDTEIVADGVYTYKVQFNNPNATGSVIQETVKGGIVELF